MSDGDPSFHSLLDAPSLPGCFPLCAGVVFVEALDKCFENVCELDLIFHSDKVQITCHMLYPDYFDPEWRFFLSLL